MNKTTAKGVLTDLLYAYAADEYGDYFYEHGDVVCEAVECIMREQPQWISVEDRLPENDGHVLIYSLGGGVAEGIYSKIYKKWVQYRWSIFEPEVTHWMPLPEPPKEEV